MHEVSDIMFRCQKSARNLAEGTYMSPEFESVPEGFVNQRRFFQAELARDMA